MDFDSKDKKLQLNFLYYQPLQKNQFVQWLRIAQFDFEKQILWYNNHIHNLEWVTKSENTRHAHLTGLFKNKLTIDQVKQIKLELQTRKDYAAIGLEFGVGRTTIWKIAIGILYDYV